MEVVNLQKYFSVKLFRKKLGITLHLETRCAVLSVATDIGRAKGSFPKFSSNIKQIEANELTFIPPKIIRKPVFLMILRGSSIAQICLILEVKFGDDP